MQPWPACSQTSAIPLDYFCTKTISITISAFTVLYASFTFFPFLSPFFIFSLDWSNWNRNSNRIPHCRSIFIGKKMNSAQVIGKIASRSRSADCSLNYNPRICHWACMFTQRSVRTVAWPVSVFSWCCHNYLNTFSIWWHETEFSVGVKLVSIVRHQ